MGCGRLAAESQDPRAALCTLHCAAVASHPCRQVRSSIYPQAHILLVMDGHIFYLLPTAKILSVDQVRILFVGAGAHCISRHTFYLSRKVYILFAV